MSAIACNINILVGFEESQAVMKAFRKRGFNAYSCDTQECSGGDRHHLRMDIFDSLMWMDWDLIILHPPCTFTAVCGNRWYSKSNLRIEGIELCKDSSIMAKRVCDRVALEQPKTIMQRYIGKKSQVIHPWQFGHGETKETWLWLHNLPNLIPTNIVEGREQKIWKMSPGPERAKMRSKTYPGIAEAMAEQWGNYLLETL